MVAIRVLTLRTAFLVYWSFEALLELGWLLHSVLASGTAGTCGNHPLDFPQFVQANAAIRPQPLHSKSFPHLLATVRSNVV